MNMLTDSADFTESHLFIIMEVLKASGRHLPGFSIADGLTIFRRFGHKVFNGIWKLTG
jgi:hypothetical protein